MTGVGKPATMPSNPRKAPLAPAGFPDRSRLRCAPAFRAVRRPPALCAAAPSAVALQHPLSVGSQRSLLFGLVYMWNFPPSRTREEEPPP
jgi:hypothetical protein